MTQIVNWNFVPGGFNPTYSWQLSTTAVNTPMWTSTVTGATDMFQSAQQTDLLKRIKRKEEIVEQLRKDVASQTYYSETAHINRDLLKNAEKELAELRNEYNSASQIQGKMPKVEISGAGTPAVQTHVVETPVVQAPKVEVSKATPVVENTPVPTERALVPFRPAQSQTVPPVQPHVENTTTQALVPFKPTQTQAVGPVKPVVEAAPQEIIITPATTSNANGLGGRHINPNAFEYAEFEEVINRPTPVVPGKVPFKPAAMPEGPLNITGIHGVKPNNVVNINQGLVEMPAAASVGKERGFFGKLFDRIFSSRADKIAKTTERAMDARMEANEAYRTMRDSRQALRSAKQEQEALFRAITDRPQGGKTLKELATIEVGTSHKYLNSILDDVLSGKKSIKDFEEGTKLREYLEKATKQASLKESIPGLSKEFAQKNSEYLNKLNEVEKAQKRLKWLQRGTDAQAATVDVIGKTEKEITRATDKASALLEGADKSTIKEALGKKGLSKCGKIAIAAAAAVVVGLGIAWLCGAFKKKDKEGQPAQEPTDKTNPAAPTNPEEPTVPVAPEEPTEPTVPVAPVEPTKPTVPTEPTEPTVPVAPSDRFDYNPGGDFTVVKGDNLWKIVKGIYNKKDPNFSSLPKKEQDRKIIYGIRKMVAANGLKYKAKDEKNPHYYVPIYPGQVLKQVELD